MPVLRVTRREFTASSLAPLVLALGQARPSQMPAGARLIDTVPFELPRDAAPLEQLLGSGLDARLFTDLSSLDPVGQRITPVSRFFIRTAASPRLPGAPWKVHIGGLSKAQPAFAIDELARLAVPAGTHLLE